MELAVANTLAWGVAPIMPQFAAHLHSALGVDKDTTWAGDHRLMEAGQTVNSLETSLFSSALAAVRKFRKTK